MDRARGEIQIGDQRPLGRRVAISLQAARPGRPEMFASRWLAKTTARARVRPRYNPRDSGALPTSSKRTQASNALRLLAVRVLGRDSADSLRAIGHIANGQMDILRAA